jgi:type VI secretion system protein ImpK
MKLQLRNPNQIRNSKKQWSRASEKGNGSHLPQRPDGCFSQLVPDLPDPFFFSGLNPMQERTANLVHPVVTYGLRLKERLAQGEKPDLSTEQTKLKGLLAGQGQARGVLDWAGDSLDPIPSAVHRPGESGRRGGDGFLGLRYALACWLDEIFILDSPWGEAWKERSLEWALYTSNDRAWKFWEQAKLAEGRPGTDALESFYLCVMLGFRGDLVHAPDRLQAWRNAVEGRITQGPAWTEPPSKEPDTNVHPLHGRERLRRMILAGLLMLGLLIPFVTFFLTNPR